MVWTALSGTGCMDLNAKAEARTRPLMRKKSWLQQLKDFDCTVTSTWKNNEDNREFHTWQAWVSSLQKKARLHHGLVGHMLYDVVLE